MRALRPRTLNNAKVINNYEESHQIGRRRIEHIILGLCYNCAGSRI